MAIPIIAGLAISALGSFLKNRAAKKAAKEQANLNNAFTAKQEAARTSILEGLKAKGYDIFGPQKTSRTGGGTTSQTSRSTSRTRGTTKSTRTVLGANQAAEDLLRRRIEGRLIRPAGVEQGEILAGVAAANRGSAAAQRAVANKVAGRGLVGAQAAGAYSPIEMGRVSEINQFLASIPGLARQRQAEDEAAASGFLAERAGTQQDIDQTTNMTGSQEGTSSDWGENIGGPDIGAIQSLMMPVGGPQQSTQTGQSTFGDIASGVGSGLAQYGAAGGTFGRGRGGGGGGGGGFVPPPLTPNTGQNFGQGTPSNFLAMLGRRQPGQNFLRP